MRTTLNLADDALLVAQVVATRERVSLGEAVSRLVRLGAGASSAPVGPSAPLRGRFALLPCRDEVITPRHIRELTGQARQAG